MSDKKNLFNKHEFTVIGELADQYSFYRCVLEIIETLTGKPVVNADYGTTPICFFDSTGENLDISLDNEIFSLTPKETGIIVTYYLATKKGFSALVSQIDKVIPETLSKRLYEEFFVKVDWRTFKINSLTTEHIES